LLEIAPGSAALDIQRIAYIADGRCVEFTRSFYRSDTFDFVAELTLSSTSRQSADGAAR
jgi:GntR family transcriptional regulator